MTRLKYFIASIVIGMVISGYFFRPAQNIKIDEIQLEQLKLDIKDGLEKNLKTYTRTSYEVSVRSCVINIRAHFTEICRHSSENTKKITNIYLPEMKNKRLFISKKSGSTSFMFEFTDSIIEVIKKSRQIYLDNKPKTRKPYPRGPVPTPTEYVFNPPGQISQKYLRDNHMKSSELIYSCSGKLYSQLYVGGITLHFKIGNSSELRAIHEKIEKYSNFCVN